MSNTKSTEWSQLSKTWKIMLAVLGIVLFIVIPGSSLIVLVLVILKFACAGRMVSVRKLRRYSRIIYTSLQKAR
jgi:hypothetical protein